MKRFIALLLATLLLLCGCSSDEKKEKHISSTIFDDLLRTFYQNDISDYRLMAALVNCDIPLDGNGYRYTPEEPDGRTESHAKSLISLAFARRGGLDIYAEFTESSLEALKTRIATPDSLSAYEIFLCTVALRSFDVSFDREKVTSSLKCRQNEITGGFYDYVPDEGGGQVACETEASAYAFMTYVMLKSDADDFSLDNALIYLANLIENDNTVLNSSGKSSCRSTAIVLTALLASGIPLDGEISTALLNAINGFKTSGRYSDLKGGAPDKDTDIWVLLCASCAIYGNPFTK